MSIDETNQAHADDLRAMAGAAANAVFSDAVKEVTGTPGVEPVPVLQRRMMDRLRSYDLTQRAGTVLARPDFLEEKPPC